MQMKKEKVRERRGGREKEKGDQSREAPCGAESRSNLFHFEVLQRCPCWGLPLWAWRRDFSRSASENSRNTTEHRLARLVFQALRSASLFLPRLTASFFAPNRLFPTIFARCSWFYPAPVGIQASFLGFSVATTRYKLCRRWNWYPIGRICQLLDTFYPCSDSSLHCYAGTIQRSEF